MISNLCQRKAWIVLMGLMFFAVVQSAEPYHLQRLGIIFVVGFRSSIATDRARLPLNKSALHCAINNAVGAMLLGVFGYPFQGGLLSPASMTLAIFTTSLCCWRFHWLRIPSLLTLGLCQYLPARAGWARGGTRAAGSSRPAAKVPKVLRDGVHFVAVTFWFASHSVTLLWS